MEERKETAKMGLTEEDVRGSMEEPEGGRPRFDPREMLKAMGDKRFDVEAYLASEDAKDHAEMMGICMRKGEGTPEDMEYWRTCGKGMKKELHGDPADVHTKWASYLPLAAVEGTETGRKFPLIFNLHGAHNPILMTESCGITQLAAREECIVIAPSIIRSMKAGYIVWAIALAAL